MSVYLPGEVKQNEKNPGNFERICTGRGGGRRCGDHSDTRGSDRPGSYL